jgi:AbiEi antitoxin C-terminal domain
MKISSPELTALDLLRYARVAGTLDSIATVVSDLGAKLHAAPLAALAPAFERSVLQRLGYLLDFVNQADCANMLHDYLQKARPLPWIELEPSPRRAKSKPVIERDTRWNVIVHRKPQLDE